MLSGAHSWAIRGPETGAEPSPAWVHLRWAWWLLTAARLCPEPRRLNGARLEDDEGDGRQGLISQIQKYSPPNTHTPERAAESSKTWIQMNTFLAPFFPEKWHSGRSGAIYSLAERWGVLLFPMTALLRWSSCTGAQPDGVISAR